MRIFKLYLSTAMLIEKWCESTNLIERNGEIEENKGRKKETFYKVEIEFPRCSYTKFMRGTNIVLEYKVYSKIRYNFYY